MDGVRDNGRVTASADDAPAPRRTQRERREATVGKLVDATIDAISQVGYARASVQEICRRAGVSHGGLFRHFDTRLDLIVTVTEEVCRRQIANFVERIRPVSEEDTDFLVVLQALRAASRSDLNLVWFELLIAARTDEELKLRLAPTIDQYSRDIYTTALNIPAIARQPEDIRQAAVFSGVHFFDGETFVNAVYPRPDLDDKRLRLIANFYLSTLEPE